MRNSPPTQGLNESAESESSRRFAFSAFLATTCGASIRGESSAALAHGRSRPALSHKLSRSLLGDDYWVNDVVGFGGEIQSNESRTVRLLPRSCEREGIGYRQDTVATNHKKAGARGVCVQLN